MDNLNSFLILPSNLDEPVQFFPNSVSNNFNILNTSILTIGNDEASTGVKFFINEGLIGQPLTDNTENDTTELTFDCLHCTLKFVGYDEYLEHIETHQSSKFECPRCDQVFKRKITYFKHLINHQEEKLFNCPVCEIGFNYEDNLKIHMTCHSKNCSVCPICGLKFQRVASLKSHLKIHQIEEFYTCWECSSEFDAIDELKRHLRIHTRGIVVQTKKSVCKYCKVEFESGALLRKHILSHVELKKLVESRKRRFQMKKEFKHRCTICSKTFSKLSLLQRHNRTHTGERPYVCWICRNRFSDKSSLNMHILMHTGLKPFACTLCPAQFAQKCNLKVHVQRTHTAQIEGEKSFKCSKCDCIYKKVASLNAHMSKMHSNDEEILITSVINQLKNLQDLTQNRDSSSKLNTVEKSRQLNEESKVQEIDDDDDDEDDGTPISKVYMLKQKYVGSTKIYYCSYCNKEFKKPSDLIRHLRVHTKEKPYKCHCGNSFSLKSTLLSHMKVHEWKDGKACTKCSKIFYTSKGLNGHMKKHEIVSSFSDGNLNNLEDTELRWKPKSTTSDEKIESNESSRTVQIGPSNSSKFQNTAKKFICDICDKTFKLKSRLNIHIRKHKVDDTGSDCKETNQISTGNNEIPVNNPISNADVNQDMQRILVNCPEFSGDTNQIFTDLDPKNTFILDSVNNLNQPIILDIQTINLANPQEKFTKIVLDSNENFPIEDNIHESKNFEANSQNSVPIDGINQNDQSILCVSLTGNDNLDNGYSIHCLKCKKLLDVNNFGGHVCLKSILKKNNIVNNDNVKVDESKENDQKKRKIIKRNFECVYCRKHFNTRGAYVKHVQFYHQKEKNIDGLHKCTFCVKSFKKPSDLSRHLRTHTGEKPFVCGVCDRKFSLKSTLEGHYRTHDPVATKNFVCEVCNSCFSSNSSRKLHMLVHTGVRPHKCLLCNQDFRTLAHKRSHEKKIHLNKKNPTKKQKKNKISNILATAAEMIVNENKDFVQENNQFNEIQLEFPDNNDSTIKLTDSIQLDQALLQQLQTSEVLLQDLDTDFLQSSVVGNFDEKVDFQESKKQIECEICRDSFNNKELLTEHMQVHSKNKGNCEKLNENFSSSSLFVCFVCDTSFTALENLKTHLKSIHNFTDKVTLDFEDVYN